MPSTDAPNWWADVQQEREDLSGAGRRPADDWLGEEIDFVPRRRMSRSAAVEGAGHPLHGVFVPAAAHAPVRQAVTTSRTIELTTSADEIVITATPADVAHELAHLRAADDPFASPPPPPGARRTVQIKGRPANLGLPSMAQRHRGRTASERVGPRPDRIALWAVALGAILILLAAMTSSSQAAVTHRAVSAPAVTAKVTHGAHHAPLRTVHGS
ncbi:MAG TPA: hypothetical protein VNT03_11500 [Baekduia sp.]|nr:hypothetical protein [Baekduia sp.]